MFSLAPDPVRWLWACLAVTAWLALIAATWMRRRAERRAVARAAASDASGILIAYASQGGSTLALARQLQRRLAEAGRRAQLLPLELLRPSALQAASQVCLLVSTTGEGDAPDHAAAFAKGMAAPWALGGVTYALLALGDRNYEDFCGFGRRMDDWLRSSGARPAFERVETDRMQASALGRWAIESARYLGLPAEAVPAASEHADAALAPAGHWRLMQREHLNPGSPGPPVYYVSLAPDGVLPDWQAGDIAQFAVPDPVGGGVAWREYTLCSLPQDGRADLLIRLAAWPDGRPGLGSDWLCRGLVQGSTARMRIRSNPGFHAPAPASPIILIGHGTGLAGLVAHLRARQCAVQRGGVSAGGAWLLYGERSAGHDAHFDTALKAWQRDGVLSRLDRVYSRDPGCGPRYVQEIIVQQGGALRDWVLLQGAAIYVCGRRDTMAVGVEQALQEVLGASQLARLRAAGRYRRDVY